MSIAPAPAMTVAGVWANEYDSVMSLAMSADGALTGDYASTTGSTGRYLICGRATPEPPAPGMGRPVVLSLLWRPRDGTQEDAIWHWASALAGQVLPDPRSGAAEAAPLLSLVHALVGTCPFPGLPAPATFIDKLSFRPFGAEPPRRAPLTPERPKAAASPGDPIRGAWRCAEHAGMTLELEVVDEAWGVVEGRLLIGGRELAVAAATDVFATAAQLPIQSFCMTAGLDAGPLLAASGRLELATRRLVLTALTVVSTRFGDSYGAVAQETWTFTPA